MEIKLVKFGTPVNWHNATETYLEPTKHKCTITFDGTILKAESKVSKEVMLVTIGNIAYMQVKVDNGRKAKEAST